MKGLAAREPTCLEDTMESFNLLINGRMVAGDSTMPVINPATEETLAACPWASVDQLNEAVAAAKAAFPAWAATPIDERRKAIAQIADVIEKNSGELARLLTLEQGKPIADATQGWRLLRNRR
jgi:acyl-CoA reductase-like NAD-dependent aldehyde dehydrogenase